MNVMMKLCCICPSSNEYERRVDRYEMSAEFAAIPRPGDKIVLPLAKDEERIPDQPLEFNVETVSWEVSRGQATPVLHFTITNEWGARNSGWQPAGGRTPDSNGSGCHPEVIVWLLSDDRGLVADRPDRIWLP